MRHGRATMPWGKYKGVRIRLIPDNYLSFLTQLPMMRTEKWRWLADSLCSELHYRGLRADLWVTLDPVIMTKEEAEKRWPRRAVQLEDSNA